MELTQVVALYASAITYLSIPLLLCILLLRILAPSDPKSSQTFYMKLLVLLKRNTFIEIYEIHAHFDSALTSMWSTW